MENSPCVTQRAGGAQSVCSGLVLAACVGDHRFEQLAVAVARNRDCAERYRLQSQRCGHVVMRATTKILESPPRKPELLRHGMQLGQGVGHQMRPAFTTPGMYCIIDVHAHRLAPYQACGLSAAAASLLSSTAAFASASTAAGSATSLASSPASASSSAPSNSDTSVAR